jgi:hypothetical protein
MGSAALAVISSYVRVSRVDRDAARSPLGLITPQNVLAPLRGDRCRTPTICGGDRLRMRPPDHRRILAGSTRNVPPALGLEQQGRVLMAAARTRRSASPEESA